MAIDSALQRLEAEGRPIRVAMVGAGATGRAIALQLGTPVPGMRLVAIANRTPEHAERAFREAGFTQWARVGSSREAEVEIARGVPVLTDDPLLLTSCNAIDVIVEATGTVEAAARVVLDAFEHRKTVVLVNAELDSLVGPILKARADDAGVVITHTDGDEPGVALTLLRYLQTLGLRIVAAGNIKAHARDGNEIAIRDDATNRMGIALVAIGTEDSTRPADRHTAVDLLHRRLIMLTKNTNAHSYSLYCSDGF